MSRSQLTPQAIEDLFEIWTYIARDNLEAANGVEDAVYESCDFLAEGPLRGKIRADLTNLPLRFWTVQSFANYIIPPGGTLRPRPCKSSASFTGAVTSLQFSGRPIRDSGSPCRLEFLTPPTLIPNHASHGWHKIRRRLLRCM
jgi:plasmid stabilization system protein ParE